MSCLSTCKCTLALIGLLSAENNFDLSANQSRPATDDYEMTAAQLAKLAAMGHFTASPALGPRE